MKDIWRRVHFCAVIRSYRVWYQRYGLSVDQKANMIVALEKKSANQHPKATEHFYWLITTIWKNVRDIDVGLIPFTALTRIWKMYCNYVWYTYSSGKSELRCRYWKRNTIFRRYILSLCRWKATKAHLMPVHLKYLKYMVCLVYHRQSYWIQGDCHQPIYN